MWVYNARLKCPRRGAPGQTRLRLAGAPGHLRSRANLTGVRGTLRLTGAPGQVRLAVGFTGVVQVCTDVDFKLRLARENPIGIV
jgi:hypothetical protein